jgi:hypothetical protein
MHALFRGEVEQKVSNLMALFGECWIIQRWLPGDIYAIKTPSSVADCIVV